MTGQALGLVLPTCRRKRTGRVYYLSLGSSLPLNKDIDGFTNIGTCSKYYLS